jgi:hypothetical protein
MRANPAGANARIKMIGAIRQTIAPIVLVLEKTTRPQNQE